MAITLNKLPLLEPSGGASLPRPVTSKTCMTAAMKRWRYLRRLLHYQQMDFEFAFWQMVYLISNPKVVYKNCKKIILHYTNCLLLNFAHFNLLYTSNLKIYFLSFFSVTYRKKTKAQFARDDPAFLVLLAGWLVVSS